MTIKGAHFSMNNEMKLVDLFSGCGGFSLGAHQAGYKVVAAFDNDPVLASSYSYNFPNTQMIFKDVADLDGETVRAVAKGRVDGVIGGPPCQGFSVIGKRNLKDPRNQLLAHFFRLVDELQPSFFVMENVRGLGLSNARSILDQALNVVKDEYAILGPHIWNAAHFGAATKRARLFVIGIHKDHSDALTVEEVAALGRMPVTVRSAISDLEDAIAIGEENGFDIWRITRTDALCDYARTLRSSNHQITGHRKTQHSKHIVARFDGIPEGCVDIVGRHPRLAWSSQCPSLRAGTGVDHGSYQAVRPIHPKQARVITVREAARLQGFPDCHRFHPTIWHSFRMIGNSVSPIMSHAIFGAIKAKFENRMSISVTTD